MSNPPLQDWRNILWQEWSLCHDKDYARRLYQGCGPFDTPGPMILFSSRPYAHMVELALYSACAEQLGAKYVWEKRLRQLEQAKQKTTSLDKLIANLGNNSHWFARFTARHVLVHRGGQAIHNLLAIAQNQSDPLATTAQWLVESICAETTLRLAKTKEQWLCPNCLLRCDVHWVDLRWQPDLQFYGCRLCRQSRNLLYVPGQVVARLQANWYEPFEQQGNDLYGNWLGFRHLFDFDRVQIIQATDEDVERFAVLVGNDTDSARAPRYKNMLCAIDPACNLSKNSERVLASTFGQVERAGP